MMVFEDEDEGQSGKIGENRLGFHRLLAEVMMDHVRLVLGLEMSRLARSSKDWHRLLNSRPMSYLEPLPDRESNPYAPPRAGPEPQVNSLFRDHPRGASTMRIIALAHFCVAVFFLCNVFALVYFFWMSQAWPNWQRLYLVLSVLLLPAATNIVIGVGIWTFRRWSWQLAIAQGFIVLALGIAIPVYDDLGGVAAMLPGLILIMVAVFLRYVYTSSYEGNAPFEPPAAE